jgi:DNA-directed RNA polymerase specialized sigma54-like protein
MEEAGNQDVSQIVDKQGYLLCQHHDLLAQLGKAMEEVPRCLQHLKYPRGVAFN